MNSKHDQQNRTYGFFFFWGGGLLGKCGILITFGSCGFIVFEAFLQAAASREWQDT